MQKLIREIREEKLLEKNLKDELGVPLIDEQRSRIINPGLYSEFVYEFRKTRIELEQSIERITRLIKIGILINKMKNTKKLKKLI